MVSIFRQYTFDDSFQQVFISSKFLKEYQIALTFAKDYDQNNEPTNGIFTPDWDTSKITPEIISNFKKRYPEVKIKVYISIGNCGTEFPFSPQGDNKSWILNETNSLTNIIKNNGIDGIDVFYKNIDASPVDFVECIGQLIKNLKENGVIKEASISPSFGLNKEFYFPLYSAYFYLFDWVDYQFQNEVVPIFAPNKLVEIYDELVKFYPRKKLFAGYSAENEDWATLSPIVFFLGGMDILKKKKGPGISIHYHNYYQQNSNDE